MTVIAWDGRYLVTDGRTTCGDQIMSENATKLHRVHHPDHGSMMAACAGTVVAVAPWLEGIAQDGFKSDTAKDHDAAGLFVDRAGRCWEAHSDRLWLRCRDHASQGSGALLANTVLRDGGTALDAVRFAIRHSSTCGGTIRVYDWSSNVIVALRP